jgi:hypothetical protein
VRHAKEHVQSLPRQAMEQYTVLLMAPTMITLLTGVGGRTRPMFNITISNVPGPEKPLYFRGAELLATYPASIVTHGQAVNITCQSYAGMMNFGYTGCHTSVPSLQRLAVYTADALAELEAAFLPASRRRQRASVRAKGTSTTSGKASGKTPAPRKAKAAPGQAQDGLTRAGGSMPRYGAGLIAAVRSTRSAAMPPHPVRPCPLCRQDFTVPGTMAIPFGYLQEHCRADTTHSDHILLGLAGTAGMGRNAAGRSRLAHGRGGGGIPARAGAGHLRSARVQAGRLRHPAQPQ